MNIALIGARSGSSMKDKNIRHLAGHSLLAWSIWAARLAGLKPYVSTDSPEYAGIAAANGAEVPFLRPAAFASDSSPDYQFIAHFLEWWALHQDTRLPEYIVHLRPTTPLRDPAQIGRALIAITENEEATSLRSVQEMSESAYKCFRIEGGYLSTLNLWFDLDNANNARQDFDTTYQPNGYVDVLRSQLILDRGVIHGDHVMPFLTEPTIEIDSEEDFRHAQYQVRENPKLVERLFG